ncbi:transcriptional regulator [Bacillus sp. OG2]|nr:transcriptional regulator [Bacillus sp. OG2]
MLDGTDKHIIEELSKNSRIKMKELGEKVHLTGQAASARVAKLEDLGVIEGYTIKVNKEKMGYPVHAILHIYTKTANHQPYLSFVKKQNGESCYLLECRFPSNERLDEFLTGLSNAVSYKLSIVISK